MTDFANNIWVGIFESNFYTNSGYHIDCPPNNNPKRERIGYGRGHVGLGLGYVQDKPIKFSFRKVVSYCFFSLNMILFDIKCVIALLILVGKGMLFSNRNLSKGWCWRGNSQFPELLNVKFCFINFVDSLFNLSESSLSNLFLVVIFISSYKSSSQQLIVSSDMKDRTSTVFCYFTSHNFFPKDILLFLGFDCFRWQSNEFSYWM